MRGGHTSVANPLLPVTGLSLSNLAFVTQWGVTLLEGVTLGGHILDCHYCH